MGVSRRVGIADSVEPVAFVGPQSEKSLWRYSRFCGEWKKWIPWRRGEEEWELESLVEVLDSRGGKVDSPVQGVQKLQSLAGAMNPPPWGRKIAGKRGNIYYWQDR
jgi:hypothetical protein